MLNPFIQKEPKRAKDCKDGIHVGAYKWATNEPTLNVKPPRVGTRGAICLNLTPAEELTLERPRGMAQK